MQINNYEWTGEFVRIDTLKEPEKLLKMAVKRLKAHKVEFYLSFGTCLGFHRDKDFIPEDSDIDISILADGVDVQPIIDDFANRLKLIRMAKDGERIYQVAYADKDGFILDLQFYYKKDDCIFSLCEGGEWNERVEKIEHRETKYGEMPFPCPTNKYLYRRYGDWETKKDIKSIKR